MLATDGAYTRPPGPADLERATQTLLNAALPGVVDCFDESMVAGQYFWHPAFPDFDIAAAPANVTAARGTTLAARREEVAAACGPALFRDLLHQNELDQKLVDRARAEVLRRFSLVPRGEERLAALREELAKLGGTAVPITVPPRPGRIAAFWRGIGTPKRRPPVT